MTHIKTSKMELLAVGVPDDLPDYYISICGNQIWIDVNYEGDLEDNFICEMPTASVRFIATTTDITEEQAAEIVDGGLNELTTLLMQNGVTGRGALIQII